jgi:hypothetical protein
MSTYTIVQASGNFDTGRPGSQIIETGPRHTSRWTFSRREDAEASRSAYEDLRHKIETAQREVRLLHNYAGVSSGSNVNKFTDYDWAAVYDRAAGYDESIVPRQIVSFKPRSVSKRDRLMLGNRVGSPSENIHVALMENAKKKKEWVICKIIDGKENAVVLMAHGIFKSAEEATTAGERVANRQEST